ncbi:BT_3928 family protein [Ancylomarina longa]|uniref:DoxX family protein n=1 Tax=Ancylomarina longa TaxID=2487017 RepID=A0A434AZJ9_9BACT|nr:BT_3928 family protein [Ancylomarina longa]RUT80048.1 DoxX family protein [Ancylomarina longa]
MKIVRFVCRILVGLVFTFSGFVKAVDPLGSTYKFSDYFYAFGMDAFVSVAFPLAIFLSTLEFVLGLSLLFNARKQIAYSLALLFMLFFTPLTLILAISNPVTDCGCFGDALVITNWQTFGKNIVILVFSLILFLGRKKEDTTYPIWQQNLLVLFSILSVLWISIFSYRHLPIIDFRPYHIGANISESMVIPEGAPADQYRSIFKYQKNGKVKEFDETNYPWQDSTWTFVDATQIKIKDGYTPLIHDFSISNEQQGDITDQILHDNSYTFILIAKDLSKIKKDVLPKIEALSLFAMEKNIPFLALTASGSAEIESFKEKNNISFEFYNTDEIQLKTIIRSNPGLILIKQGTILNKWHYNDLPKPKNLNGDLLAYSITQHQKLNIKLIIISITSTLLLIISLFILLMNRKAVAKNRLQL